MIVIIIFINNNEIIVINKITLHDHKRKVSRKITACTVKTLYKLADSPVKEGFPYIP